MNKPRIRTGIHLNEPGAPYPASLQLSIGDTARQLDVSNARGIADRIHDLCDRIDVLNGAARPPAPEDTP